MEPNCASYNFEISTSQAGVHKCELNNSTHESNEDDLVNDQNFVYRGTKVSLGQEVGMGGGGGYSQVIKGMPHVSPDREVFLIINKSITNNYPLDSAIHRLNNQQGLLKKFRLNCQIKMEVHRKDNCYLVCEIQILFFYHFLQNKCLTWAGKTRNTYTYTCKK